MFWRPKSDRWSEIEADNEMLSVVSGYPPQIECWFKRLNTGVNYKK